LEGINERIPALPRSVIYALIFVSLLVLVPLVQVLPLPPKLWLMLPGRDVIAETFQLIGDPLPWWPISLAPEATWLSLASLIPPIAVFLSVLSLTFSQRRQLCFTLIAFGVVSVFLGLLQLAQGPQSTLRFFEITNPTEAVGFFANRNHYSALLYVTTLFAAVWAISVVVEASVLPKRALLNSRTLLLLAAALTVFSMLVIAQTMARSRAGLMLSMVALFAILLLALRHAKEAGSASSASSRVRVAKVIFATAAVTIVFSLQFALYRILDRFAVDPMEDARVLFARKTFEIARFYLPFGSGVGTFVPVYQLHEKPADIAHFFANRAHNDILETALEAGLFSLGLMLIFAVWLVRRSWASWAAWSAPEFEATSQAQVPVGRSIDRSFMRAAALGLLLLAAHSFVDYPLRTSALMVMAALCCGLLIAPYVHDSKEHQEPVEWRTRKAHRSEPELAAATIATPTAPPQHKAPRPRQTWVPDKELPASWRKTDESTAAQDRPPPGKTSKPDEGG
jgi:O-antigen ligase